MNDNDVLEQAYETIDEWGINEDGFIMENFKNIMSGGNPSDNSIELSDFFKTQLITIVDLGLERAREILYKTHQTAPGCLFTICRRYLAAKDRWDTPTSYANWDALKAAKREYEDAERELREYFKDNLANLKHLCRRYLSAKDRWEKTFSYEDEAALKAAKREYWDAERELREYLKEG